MRYQLPTAIAILLCAASLAEGQTINWGNDPGDLNFDSEGGGLDTTFTFQFGVFASGFDPHVEAPETWGSAWTPLDTAVYNEPAGYFSDSWVVTDNTYEGRQAYIFVFNDADMNLMPDDPVVTGGQGMGGTEWFLATNSSWTIPQHLTEDGQGQGGGQLGLPEEWRIQTVSEVLFGRTETITGGGERDESSPPPSLTIQTHSFSPIPETETALLFGALLGVFVLRRSRIA